MLMTIHDDDYKDERWIKLREQRKAIDNYTCTSCDSQEKLHVHHLAYIGERVWDTPIEHLITYCASCHQKEHDRIWKTSAKQNFINLLFEHLERVLPNQVRKHQGGISIQINSPKLKNQILIGFAPKLSRVHRHKLSAIVHCPLNIAEKLVDKTTLKFKGENVAQSWKLNEEVHIIGAPFPKGFDEVQLDCVYRWDINPDTSEDLYSIIYSNVAEAVKELKDFIEGGFD